MKKYAGTVLSACVVLTLIIFSLVFTGKPFSEDQQATLKILLVVCGFAIIYCFVIGEITRNNSQMDKLWSILPVIYTWIIADRGHMQPRLVIYALIATAWGVRLTINFARKGAYRLKFWEGTEDYRWSILREKPVFKNRFVWALFDLFFISTYQNLLVLAICLPMLACMDSTAPFGIWDTLAIVLSVSFLVLETVSDRYQWNFHQQKNGLLASGEKLTDLPFPYNLGFNTFGPWAYMRHPNYLGEQGIWNSLYLFTIASGVTSHMFFHWTFIGPLLLILLFMGSSALGEKISSGKYPQYADYTEQVLKYIPLRRFEPEQEKTT